MKRFSLLSEQDVLQELDVPTFRHVTKDKLMSFVAMRQCMDPETAQKALEQVPHLTQSLSEILGDYSDLIKQGLASNDEHTRAYFAIAETTIEALQRELDKPNLTFEERCAVMDRMLVVNEQISGKVTEGQKFITRGQIIVGSIIVFGIGIVATVFGANTNFQITKPKT